jgi:sugar phosphate isomerase/epimerase
VPGAGVLIDPLQLFRTGATVAQISLVDPSALSLAQLCDADSIERATDLEALRTEAVSGRLPPGDGVFPLADFVKALPLDAALSVEVPYVPGRGELEHALALYLGGRSVLDI